jgi:Ca2+-binding EF-hand superfamily protein
MTRGTKRLGERETAELREAFELFDSEKSGKINL